MDLSIVRCGQAKPRYNQLEHSISPFPHLPQTSLGRNKDL